MPPQSLTSSLSIISSLSTVRLKILNYEPLVYFQDLKASLNGKLVSIRGSVIRVGHIKHIAEWSVFMCRKCNLQKIVKQPQGIYTVPKKCNVCGVSKFRAMLDAPQMKTVFFQTLKVQELLNTDQSNRGGSMPGMPRVFDVELMDYLVNTCIPGDDITLTGIIKGTSNAKSRKKVSFSLYMEAITTTNNKQRFQNRNNSMDNEMSIKDYLMIKKMYDTPNLFPLLVHSLCPSIYGHEMIKAGLLLSLFGGNAERSKIRDNIHVLIVGDPGLGKSQMLQACARVAAKGIYVCGNTSTSSGLTITVTKGSKDNNFSLEPGALVLADKGCCCIDEFDKMSKQYAALLESMEQQCVSVAKSGIVCSLPTRTSILAAANPINGRFNRSKTVVENLKMSPPLLSRFDLIFLLLDEPNEQLDDLLCKHVMSYHTNRNATNKAQMNIFQHIDTSNTVESPLRSKLKSPVVENIEALSQSVLQKYISYARRYVKPRITKEAAAVLQNYYLELRRRTDKCGGLCIHNRKLEAMIRLTEARAKLELRTEATEADAMDIIEILRYTFDKISSWQLVGHSKVTDKKAKGFIQLLRKETLFDKQKTFSKEDLRKIASSARFSTDNLTQFISKLNEQGILLKSGSNSFKFVSP